MYVRDGQPVDQRNREEKFLPASPKYMLILAKYYFEKVFLIFKKVVMKPF
jgi:hypothetical protein